MPIVPTGIPWNNGFTWLDVNYAPIAVLGTLLLVGGWWMISANKWFKGPIPQGNEEELERIESNLRRGRPTTRCPRRRLAVSSNSEGAGSRRPPPSSRRRSC